MDLNELQTKAEAGSVVAQSTLGISFLHGINVHADYEVALKWLAKAAERGEWLAAIQVARMYRDSRGTAADKEAALSWYQVAVSHSDNIIPCEELTKAVGYVSSHMVVKSA